MVLALIFLSLAVVCYSISQLAQHGKLKGQKDDTSFWGEKSWFRKYKPDDRGHPLVVVSRNWYNKLFNVDFKERWPTSTNLTVFLTDGYHFMQFMFFNLLSLSITFALGFQWLTLGLVWGLIHILHATIYRLLSK